MDSRVITVGNRTQSLVLSVCIGLRFAAHGAWAGDMEAQGVNGIPSPSIATNLPQNRDTSGIRKWLSERGITYTVIYTSETLTNVSGGLRRGTLFEGKLDAQLSADLEKLIGWKGVSFYANVFQHGTAGPRRDFVGNQDTISNIEALPTTRLSEMWLEQKFFSDKASIRIGQLASDQEFFISGFSDMFLTSDWPTITAVDLPSGGPAYPLSTPGVRLKVEPTKQIALLVALFNGDPAGPGLGNPEERNRHGVNFRVNDPPFLIGEAQYKYNQDAGLAGTSNSALGTISVLLRTCVSAPTRCRLQIRQAMAFPFGTWVIAVSMVYRSADLSAVWRKGRQWDRGLQPHLQKQSI